MKRILSHAATMLAVRVSAAELAPTPTESGPIHAPLVALAVAGAAVMTPQPAITGRCGQHARTCGSQLISAQAGSSRHSFRL